MESKRKFTVTGYYHIFVALCSATLILVTLAKNFSLITLLVFLIPLTITACVGWAGYRAKEADRRALWVLIVFNALHLVTFHIGQSSYQFLMGPILQFGLPDGDFIFGFSSQLEFGWHSWKTDNWFFNVNLIHVGFLLYLLDQIRFVPRTREQAWETEYTAPEMGSGQD